MVGIVSGNSVGLNSTTAATLGQRGSLGQANEGTNGERDYVNIATGGLVVQDFEGVLDSRGQEIGVNATYNSAGNAGAGGDVWHIGSYDQLLNMSGTPNSNGSTIQKNDADGTVTTYAFDTVAQVYRSTEANGNFDTLSYDASSDKWTWTDAKTQNKEVFEANADASGWRLHAAVDTKGNAVTYNYTGSLLTSIQNANGDSVEFTYENNKVVQESIKGADGASIRNTYYIYQDSEWVGEQLYQVKVDLSPADNSIEDGAFYTTTYTYLPATDATRQPLLTSMTQSDGTVVTFGYLSFSADTDGDGWSDGPWVDLLFSISDSRGNQANFDYDFDDHVTNVADRLGNQNTYTYNDKNQIVSIAGPAVNGITQTVQYDYDDVGNIIKVTDAIGTQTVYTYDSNGDILTQEDSLGNKIQNTYTADHHLLVRVLSSPEKPDQVTQYVYDGANVRYEVSAEGLVTDHRYDSYGQETSTVTYPSAKVNVSVPVNFSLTLSDLDAWVANQDIGQSNRIDYQYNARGQQIIVTSYPHVDAFGNGIADGTQSSLHYTYDASGALLQKIDPNGNQTSFTYDGLGRILTSTDSTGQVVTTQYDDFGHTIRQTQADGRVDISVYNDGGQLISRLQGSNAQTEYRYDVLGRLALTIDPTGAKLFYLYDAAGNLSAQIDGNGKVTQYSYNALGQRTMTDVHSIALSSAQMELLSSPYDTHYTVVPNSLPTDVPEWDKTVAYHKGDKVVFGGKLYQARLDSSGELPDSFVLTNSGPYQVHFWTEISGVKSSIAWDSAQINSWIAALGTWAWEWDGAAHDPQGSFWTPERLYHPGERMVFNGILYEAKIDSQGVQPDTDVVGSGTSWEIVSYDQAPVEWQPERVYLIGDTVIFHGLTYVLVQRDMYRLPPDSGIWRTLIAPGATPTYTFPQEYIKGETVLYNGHLWQSQMDENTSNPDWGWPIPALDPNWGWPNPSAGEPSWIDLGEVAPLPTWDPSHLYSSGELVVYEGHLWQAGQESNSYNPTSGLKYRDWDGADYWFDLGPTTTPETTFNLSSLPAPNVSDQVSYTLYDADGRLSQTIDPAGHVTEYQYDGAGNLIEATQYNTTIDTSVLNKDSLPQDLSSIASTDDRSTFYYYNLDNQKIGLVDAGGDVTQFKYDDAGRLVETIRFATQISNASIASDFASLLPAVDPADQHTLGFYDGEGRLIGSIDAENYLTEFSYDQNGNLVRTTRYATAISAPVDAGADLDDLRPAVNSKDETSSNSYDALNRLVSSTNAEGTVSTYQYDVAGNLRAATVAYASIDAKTVNQRFDQMGRVTGVLSPQGSALLVAGQTPAQVEAIWAQYSTTYTYDAAGRKTSMTDANGNKTRYYYDQIGHLTHTINALGEVQEQRYNALGQLTDTIQYGTRLTNLASFNGGLTDSIFLTALAAIADPSLDSVNSVSYNLDGTIATTTDALGNVTSYGYDSFGEQTSIAWQPDIYSPAVVTDIAYDKRGLETDEVQDVDGRGVTTHVDYDAFGRPILSIDANWNITQRSYDRLGRTVRITDPAMDASNGATSTSYDAFDRVLTQTDLRGNTTSYSYDDAARSVSITTPDQVTVTTVHNREGQTQSVRDGNGKTTTFVYDTNGDLQATNRPLSSADNFYDKVGNLIQTVDGNGNAVNYAYDAANRVLTRTVDPSGLNQVTSYSYDAEGRRISVTDANHVVTQFQYDLKGQLVQQIVDPGQLNLVTQFNYDSQGNTIEVTDANGIVTQYTYDSQGHRSRQNIDPEGLGLITDYFYDSNGNVTNRENPDGMWTRFDYDADNRLIAQIDNEDGLGLTTRYAYDGNGNLTDRTDPNGVVTHFDYDVDNRLSAQVVDPVGLQLTTHFTYDGNGNIINRTDPNGAVTHFNYDANGRVSYQVIDPTGLALTTHYTYDGNGNVTNRTDPNGVVTHFDYDVNNRVSYQIVDPTGLALTTHYTYDGNGNVSNQTDPNGTLTDFTYDANNRLVARVRDPGGLSLTTQYGYDDSGNVIYRIDPNGVATNFDYDDNNRVTVQTVAPGELNLTTSFTYDSNGNVIDRTDPNGVVTHFDYDIDGRLSAQIVDPNGLALTTLYSRDANGNVIDRTDPNGTITHFDYDTNNRVIAQVTDPNGLAISTLYAYDGIGRVADRTDPNGNVTHFDYDANGRVKNQIIDPTGLALKTSYSYDANGNLSVRTDANSSTFYIYDNDNRLVFTKDGNGAVTQRFYDKNGNVLKVIAYASTASQTLVPTLSNFLASVPGYRDVAHDAVTINVYDAAGRMVDQVSGAGQVTTVNYDANGNVTDRVAYANPINVNLLSNNPSPGDIKTLVTADPSRDHEQRMVYDTDGRVTAVATAQHIDGSGVLQWSVVSQTYDGNGNVSSTTAYANFLSSSELVANPSQGDVDAWLSSVAADEFRDNTTRMLYDSNNRLTFTVDALGDVSQRIYDADGNVTRQITFVTPVEIDGNLTLEGLAEALIPEGNSYDPRYGYGPNSWDNWNDWMDNTVARVSATYFDRANRVAFQIDTIGNLTAYQYDSAGNLTAKTAFAQLQLSPQEDMLFEDLQNAAESWGYPGQDRVQRNVYDSANRLTYSVDGEGDVTQSMYDGVGNVLSTIQYAERFFNDSLSLAAEDFSSLDSYDVNNRTTSYTYDAQGNVLSTTDAMQQTEHNSYDALGRKLSFTNKAGNTWNYAYDAAGNLVSELDPPVVVSTLVPNSGANSDNTYGYSLTTQQSVRVQTTMVYDTFGHVISRTEAANQPASTRTTSYQYDLVGRQVKIIYPPVSVYSSTDDLAHNGVLGVATRSEQIVTPTSSVTYDALGNAVSSVDVGGNESYKIYDSIGRVRYDIDALGYVTGYERDAFGNVTALTRYAVPLNLSTDPATSLSKQRVQLAQLYATLLGRPPELTGMAYWISSLESGVSLESVASDMLSSDEAKALYPAGMDVTSFVTKMYQLALGRAPDAYGLAYWTASANEPGKSRGLVVEQFIAGILERGDTDTQYFNNLVKGNLADITTTQLTVGGIEDALADQDHTADRTILTKYDSLDHAIQVTEPVFLVYDVTAPRYQGQLGMGEADRNKITNIRYNAFGEAIEQSIVGVADSDDFKDAIGSDTRYYYDRNGRNTAILQFATDGFAENAAQSVGGGLPAGYGGYYGILNDWYVTTMDYDQAGNVIRKTEYASMVDESNGLQDFYFQYPESSADDRITEYGYDLDNRKVSETKVGASYSTVGGNSVITHTSDDEDYIAPTTTYTYDAVGNLTSTRDADGGTSYSYYDKIGHVTATVSSAHALTEYKLDVYGNVVQSIAYATRENSASLVGYSPLQSSGNDRKTETLFDASGHAIENIDAENHASFASYDAYGRLAKQWQRVTSSTGPAQTSFTVNKYDELGQLVGVIAPAAAHDIDASYGGVGSVTLSQQQNLISGFGEVVSRVMNGHQFEYDKYDNAGHVINTNAGDGIAKELAYNLDGQVTRTTIHTADDLETDKTLVTETYYDHLGHVIAQVGVPQKIDPDSALSTTNLTVSATNVPSDPTKAYVSSTTTVVGTGGDSPLTRIDVSWTLAPANQVNVDLSSLSDLGSGDVKIQIDYSTVAVPERPYSQETSYPDNNYTIVYDQGYSAVPAENLTTSMVFREDQLTDNNGRTSATVNWSSGGPVDQISHIQVWKKDVTGQWVKVIDNGGGNQSSNYIKMAVPASANGPVTVRYQPVGGSSTWTDVDVVGNFGDMILVDASNLPDGKYDFQLVYQGLGDTEPTAHGDAHVSVLSMDTQITRLYVTLLGRVPDAPGLAYFRQLMRQGASLASIASTIYHSDEAVQDRVGSTTGLVTELYIAITGHSPSSGDLAKWNAQIAALPAESVGQVIVGIINSLDSVESGGSALFDNKVTVGRLYAGLLGLNANNLDIERSILGLVTEHDTATALAYAVGLDQSAQVKAVRTSIAQLYVMLFARAPERAGLDYWSQELLTDGTKTLATIAREMVNAPESLVLFHGDDPHIIDNEALIDNIFQFSFRYFTGNTIGREYQWIARLNQAAADTDNPDAYGQVLCDLLNAVENPNVDDYYGNQLKPLFDSEVNVGIVYAAMGGNDAFGDAFDILASVQGGFTSNAIDAAAIDVQHKKNSPYIAQITQLYVLIFDRAPDEPGLMHYVNLMEQGTQLWQIAQTLYASPEGTTIYGDTTVEDSSVVVASIYNNALGGSSLGSVAADQAKWTAALNAKPYQERGKVLLQLLQDIESPTTATSLSIAQKTLFNNKTTVGQVYAANLDGRDLTTEHFLMGLVSTEDTATALAAAVDATAASPTLAAQRRAITQLYTLILGRTPELGGVNYYVNDLNNGQSLADIAQSIYDSDEAHRSYNHDNGALAANIVTQVLGYPADSSLISAWTSLLNSNAGNEGSVLADITQYVTTTGGTGTTLFNNKVNLGLVYAIGLGGQDAVSDSHLFTPQVTTSNTAVAVQTAIRSLLTASTTLSTVELVNVDDAANNPENAVSSASPVTYQAMDRWGNVTALVDPRKNDWISTFTYNVNNQLTHTVNPVAADITDDLSAKDPTNGVTSYYDAAGHLVATTDAEGHTTQYIYDGDGNLSQELHPDGGVVTYTTDVFGQRMSMSLSTGEQTSYSYDHLGHVKSTDSAIVQVSNVTATNAGGDNLLSNDPTFSWERLEVDFTYDELGRRTSVKNGSTSTNPVSLSSTTTAVYDLAGNVIDTTDGLNRHTYFAYDDFHNKTAQKDNLGNTLSWVSNAYGRVSSSTDMGGNVTNYTYNLAGQLIEQYGSTGNPYGSSPSPENLSANFNPRPQDLVYTYDGNWLAEIYDTVSGQKTDYSYDFAGHRVAEKTVAVVPSYNSPSDTTTRVVQDIHTQYDALGRIARVDDGRYDIQYDYDLNGNRTHVETKYVADVGAVGYTASTSDNSEPVSDPVVDIDNWNTFDAMNRELIANGIKDSAGKVVITATQGHAITYFTDGNRKTDTYGGIHYGADNPDIADVIQGPASGFTTESYSYDAAGRLGSIVRDGALIDTERYDALGDVAISGIIQDAGFVDQTALTKFGITNQYQLNVHDNGGQLLFQTIKSSVGGDLSDIANTFDGVGNLDLHVQNVHAGVNSVVYSYDYSDRFLTDSYKQRSVVGNVAKQGYIQTEHATTYYQYDSNGQVVGTVDKTLDFSLTHNGTVSQYRDATVVQRSLINNAQGQVLQNTLYAAQTVADPSTVISDSANPLTLDLRGSTETHGLIVNGQSLGSSSVIGAANGSSFGDNVQALSGNTTSTATTTITYTLTTSDILSGITQVLQDQAQAAWGDSSLWYVIANANGIGDGYVAAAGNTITIPAKPTTVHNNYQTYTPYNPAKAIGETDPVLQAPPITNPGGSDGCGIANFIVAAISAVVSFYAGPVIGSLVGQLAGNLLGTQDGFSVTGLVAGVVTQQLGLSGDFTDSAPLNMALNAAVQDGVGQGINMAIGTQHGFNWTEVGASFISAPIANQIGATIAGGTSNAFGQFVGGAASDSIRDFAGHVVQGVIRQTVVRSLVGGTVNYLNIATNAFGQVIEDQRIFNSLPNESAAERERLEGYAGGSRQSNASDYSFGNALGESLAAADRPTTFAEDMANRSDPSWLKNWRANDPIANFDMEAHLQNSNLLVERSSDESIPSTLLSGGTLYDGDQSGRSPENGVRQPDVIMTGHKLSFLEKLESYGSDALDYLSSQDFGKSSDDQLARQPFSNFAANAEKARRASVSNSNNPWAQQPTMGRALADQFFVGPAKGLVQGTTKFAMNTLNVVARGSQMSMAIEGGVDPVVAEQMANESAARLPSGQIWDYNGRYQQTGGIAGEFLSPSAYGKVAQGTFSLARAGVNRFSPVAEGVNSERIFGAAAQPRVKWAENPNGLVRTPQEVIALAESHGVVISEDVSIHFVENDQLLNSVGAKAEYSQLPRNAANQKPGDLMTWDSLKNSQGKIPVRFSTDLLTSDEAAVAHIGHEMFELNKFEDVGSMKVIDFRRAIMDRNSGGVPNNWHEQAWDYADLLIQKMRGGN
ncbi:DUF4214 domain-containing protein [Undibacterium sp. TJN25]|uniref:DUF4214 domain-containing protein n=1 Tax=Undibacterium sp. TJN25 TaxID=3413056 RepID=UPI003BF065E7